MKEERPNFYKQRIFDRFTIAILLIVCALLLGAAYMINSEYTDETDNLTTQAQAIAFTADTEAFATLTGTYDDVNSPIYQEIKRNLHQVDQQSIGGVHTINIIGQRDSGKLFYYVGSDDPAGDDSVVAGQLYSGARDVAQVFQTGAPVHYLERIHNRGWLTSAAPIKDPEGRVIAAVVVNAAVSNVTIEVLYRVILPNIAGLVIAFTFLMVLRRINRRQLETTYQRSMFLSTTSHDIRSPLRGVMWALDLMKNPKADRKELIEKMEFQLKYISRLVDSVLNTIRVDVAMAKFKKTKQDIVPLVEQAIATNELSADQFQVHIKTSLPKQVHLKVDGDLMLQAFNNLIGNAVKYTKPNSTVTVAVRETKHAVFIDVSDEGDGISPADQVKLFQPFYRTDSARLSGKSGTGMGLALIKDIVTRHKGTVTIKSALEQGSTFTVELPK